MTEIPGDLEELRDRLLEESEESVQLRLGDASIASPFTCKSTGIDKGGKQADWLTQSYRFFALVAARSLALSRSTSFSH